MKPTLEDVVRPGVVVSGYRIEKKLGAGGFGKVFLAWRDGSPCALKFLHLEKGEQQARAEAQQYREEKVRLLAECSGQGGLTGLIANGWLGETGVVARRLKDVTSRPGDPLVAWTVITYRAVGPQGRGRVAVEMELRNRGAVTWTPTGAALVGSKREELTGLTVWPVEPLPGDLLLDAGDGGQGLTTPARDSWHTRLGTACRRHSRANHTGGFRA
jgi:hypothetical protein